MGNLRRRSRYLVYPKERLGTIETIDTWNGKIISSQSVYSSEILKQRDICVDRTHAFFSKGRKKTTIKSRADYGSALDIRKVEIHNPTTSGVNVGSASGVYRYKGRFVSNKIPSSISMPDTCLGTLLPYAAPAWHKFKPGKSQASLGVFLGELQELPKLLLDSLAIFSKTWKYIRPGSTKTPTFGGELLGGSRNYLSYQFGWLPFVRDVLEMTKLFQELEQQLKELRTNNNQWRRRGGKVASGKETQVIPMADDYGVLYPILPTPCYTRVPLYTKRVTTEYKVWFKGCYRYYIPELESSRIPYHTIRKLYGVTFTPDVFWNLIPWSWLIDWTQPVGKTLSFLNDGAADNLATKYAYVMGTWKTTTHYEATAYFGRGGSVSLSTTAEQTTKGRLPAHPFGLALPMPASLDARQWSILAALGISKTPRMLRPPV